MGIFFKKLLHRKGPDPEITAGKPRGQRKLPEPGKVTTFPVQRKVEGLQALERVTNLELEVQGEPTADPIAKKKMGALQAGKQAVEGAYQPVRMGLGKGTAEFQKGITALSTTDAISLRQFPVNPLQDRPDSRKGSWK